MMAHADTAVLRVAYDDSGPANGRPLVAAHGWPDDIHCRQAVLPHLHQAGHRAYRPRLRGFGETRLRDPARPRTGQIGALGQDLADFIEALDLADAVVAGHD